MGNEQELPKDLPKPEWIKKPWAACDGCGDEAEALTKLPGEYWIYDGDPARCIACGAKGIFMSDGDEDGAWVSWEEEKS